MSEYDPHTDLDLLREFCTYSHQVVAMVDRKDEVIAALERLSKLERWMVVRWADPNYG